MKKIVQPLLMFLLLLSLNACATVGTTIEELEGQYYLNKADYGKGRTVFAARLKEKPDDPGLNYFMARFELGADNPEAALPHIQKAVRLAPDNADYRFWEGVTWWALMQPDREKAAYEKALALNPDHLSANLYLGHNMLDRGQDAAAIKRYDRVLRLNPEEPQAMFNKAVALERLGRDQEMKRAMLLYLERFPDGAMARRGTEMLNRKGDFTWRNHLLGTRTITLRALEFKAGTATLTEGDKTSLALVGSILAAKQDLNLHVVAYAKGNRALAQERALAVRDYVSRLHPKITPERLTPSWFGEPEIIKIDGRSFTRAESVSIFTKVK